MTLTPTASAPKQVAINDIGSADDFLAAVEKTLKFFNDGDLIEGTVVKIDRDEVRRRAGDGFELKAFHRDALAIGGVGLDTLRTALVP